MAYRIQVNATDYDGGIVIEAGYDDDIASFNVPAWDECGLPDLVGDIPEYTECNGVQYVIGHYWSSVEAAKAAIAEAHRAGLI